MQNDLQRTDEWFQSRIGKVTASGVYNIMKTKRNGDKTKLYTHYKNKIMLERMTATPCSLYPRDDYNPLPPPVIWGIEKEPEAREHYENTTNQVVQSIGFVNHPTISMAGASPDGLVGEDGLIEIKCPSSPTKHAAFVYDSIIDLQYLTQMQFQMACTQRNWCDFVSYYPQESWELPICKVQRVHRDDDFIEKINEEVIKFLEDVETTMNSCINESMVS